MERVGNRDFQLTREGEIREVRGHSRKLREERCPYNVKIVEEEQCGWKRWRSSIYNAIWSEDNEDGM